MDWEYTSRDEDFRLQVREFIRSHLPDDIRDRQRHGYLVDRTMQSRWLRILDDHGWSAPAWPVEFGGTGWSPVQQHIFDVERALADAPDASVGALQLVGPVLQRFGSADLQQRFLPGIRSGDIFFAQGFSEPSAGSDLVSLRTRAELDGDEFIVNGSKIWTSFAHESEMMFCLVKTDQDAKPQRSISMLLIPMDAPGVEVRPIVTIDDSHHLNEVFLDEVRVPSANLIGEMNRGWEYTKFLLDNEKTYNAHIGILKRYVTRTRELAQEVERSCGHRIINLAFERRLARLAASVEALEWSVLRALTDEGDANRIAMIAPALKIRGTELLIAFSEFHLDIAGPLAVPAFFEVQAQDRPAGAPPFVAGLMEQMIYWRASTIFGGSNDIQRMVLWNVGLRG